MVQFKLNGQAVQTTAPNNTPLLNVLSNDLKINGTKFGCGKAQCNACLVMVDGNPMKSCVAPVASVAGRSVTTLSGMKEGDKPSRLQQAFIDEQAAQCGYCTSGMIIQAQALLDRNPRPTDAEVRTALDGNLCRCGAHNRIVRAVLRAAKEA
ncbi:(2Fe-2S)-binding protein [Limnohabitans sp. Rim8]|jgi:aerobic-type carbon monoxide dehydrogenase small subunit (CoxS/CutS family)|uniref:(2Fe-2S)-binding protein n=1 Tax=Limnohabitans curvus TaxID=323423 RepID=A0A315EQ94_9BURK|nr:MULTISPECIES: (2Fe-2S)-binding protein [Limnohabitans]PUE57818.1 (2Fe-2S)-binding protein [Limnohabitans sp. Rim8]PUE59923.1 (2Fe-2S)-binding protein [Limnohabitans curvus]BDU52307.1 oxidoreductase [Limnohabitans sp. INBF002]